MAPSHDSLAFKINRKVAELIPPAEPTPYDFKPLSDLDDQKGFRKQNKFIMFYPNNVAMKGKDPVVAIKDAISKALVYYYPCAGRLREGLNDKLVVECTGEGVMFVEANANVKLDHFGAFPQPPFPGGDELLYDVPDSGDILHCPIFLIQVTRFSCGGFSFSIRLNHSVADAIGMVQFISAVAEIARGARVISVDPVWKRDLLNARDPPKVSCAHHVYYGLHDTRPSDAKVDLVRRSFFFGEKEIVSLRNHLSPLQTCTTFEVLTACLWRCRTIALRLDYNDEVRVAFPVNAREIFSPPMPTGFYGVCFGLPVARTKVGELCHNTLGYAVELVQKAKAEVTEEFMRSSADLLVLNGRASFTTVRTFFVSDHRHIRYRDIDFGWGKAIYGGPIWGGRPASFFVAAKNNIGEEGILVMVDLPQVEMVTFDSEIQKMIHKARGPSGTSSL